MRRVYTRFEPQGESVAKYTGNCLRILRKARIGGAARVSGKVRAHLRGGFVIAPARIGIDACGKLRD